MKRSARSTWMLVLIAFVLGFGFPKPGLWLQPSITYILMLMMFLSCLRINLSDSKDVWFHWRRYALVLALIFVLPSLVVLSVRGLFAPVVYVGLAIAAASPSAISVVFLADLFHGQSSKALITTVVSHLVSPVVTPLLVLLIAGKTVDIQFVSIMWMIAKVVLLPLLLAQLVRRVAGNKISSLNFSRVNSILLVLIIWGILAPTRSLVLSNIGQFLLVFCVVLLILILECIAGILIGKNRTEDTTWVISDSFKNFTLSSVISLSLFGPLAVLGSVAFTIGNNLLLIPLPWLIRKFQPKGSTS